MIVPRGFGLDAGRSGGDSVSIDARRRLLFLLVLLAVGAVMPVGGAHGASPEAGIVVDARRPGAERSPLIYGTNILWPGHANGIPDRVGIEAKYDEAQAKWNGYLPLVSELGPTILRFPGGLSANGYIWTEGIGTFRERVNKKKKGALCIIGTDEFLRFCEELDAEAMLTVNLNRATGDSPLKVLFARDALYKANADVAANWVEYCNSPNDGSNPRGGTDWAAVRARNGHAEPYGVKYWELGNELWDMPKGAYRQAVPIFSRAMKAVDPTIRIGVIDPLHAWPKARIDAWFRELGDGEGKDFDFWVRHSYSPGSSGDIRGFGLEGRGARVRAPFTVPAAGAYTIRLRAESPGGASRVRASIPGAGVREEWSLSKQAKVHTLAGRLAKGSHTLELEMLSDTDALFYHRAELQGGGGWKGKVDLKDSPAVYELFVASARGGAADRFWSAKQRRGKPLYYTEYNSVVEEPNRPPYYGRVTTLRDGLNVGQYLMFFLREGVPVATQWLLYGDHRGYGLIEGVGFDPMKGDETGRRDPHPRPSFYMIKLFRENLAGKAVPVKVQSPSFHIGPPPPYVYMGVMGRKQHEIPYLDAVAALAPDGNRLNLVVMNLHPERSIQASVQIQGFAPDGRARMQLLTGPGPGANNEPESCPKGDCVRIVEEPFRAAGALTHAFPPRSVTAFQLYRKGAFEAAPAAVGGLRAETGPKGVRLSWRPPPGARPAGYHVYRSRFSHGPYRNRVAAVPAARTAVVDAPADRGVSYTYAVRAVNPLGEEGPFSNRVTIQY